MKDYVKNKESPYLKYWDVNNMFGCEMWKSFPVNDFESVQDTSEFDENVIKSYDEETDEGYFLETDV